MREGKVKEKGWRKKGREREGEKEKRQSSLEPIWQLEMLHLDGRQPKRR